MRARSWIDLLSIAAAGALVASCSRGGTAGENGGSGERTASAPPAFALCTTCHSHESGASHRIGPNLYGVVGRRAGSASGYAYSDALKNSGILWDRTTLDAFLQDPGRYVPGTRMPIAVHDAEQRRAIVGFLSHDSR